MSKKIIISNRLPINISKNEDDGKLLYKPSAGGLATGLGTVYKDGDNIWLGWPGLYPDSENQKNEISENIKKESMRPVFLTEEDVKEYYEGFSNSTIWPLFHYFSIYTEYEDHYWEAYKRVNKKFLDELLKYAEDGDTIWIHDYQLMLLPGMVREVLPNAKIGYFHHIPFPSYEIFRCLPWRKEILEGLLGADLLGYHTYDDMRHLLSCFSRIVGLDHEMGHLRLGDRMITVDAFAMGIDFDKYATAALSRDTQKEIKSFYSSLNSEQLILSIDRLDYSKGIPQRLIAFEKFLIKYPEFQGKVSLIALVVPSREHVENYKELKEELDLLIGRINGLFSKMDWTPIYYFYRSLPFHKLSALYTMSDVALVTPLRDGMNLVCKEYVASRLDKTGVLILSEMAGSAKEMPEALIINPNDQNQLIEAMHTALTMSEEEQVRRISVLQANLKRYNINRWVDTFMDRLDYTIEQSRLLTGSLLSDDVIKKLTTSYKNAKKRILFLDYDGTLVPFHKSPEKAVPDAELKNLLKKITEDSSNKVVVISGRDKDFLQKNLGEFSVDFVAEHGVWEKKQGEEWAQNTSINDKWKEEIQPILELYVDRTPGSFIEQKDFSLAWHYRKTDPGFGELRARELISNLQYLTINMDIQILEGNKVVEIKSNEVNKGKAAAKWLTNQKWDFVFAAGDDSTDEDTFKALPENSFSIKIGSDGSAAKYHVKSHQNIRGIFKKMTQ